MIEYQNILIAPDVFDSIRCFYGGDYNSEDIDVKSYKQNLKLKILILDDDDNNGIYPQIKKIINESSDLAKNRLEIILDTFLKSGHIKFEKITNDLNYVRNKNDNYLFNLAKSSHTTIINSERNILIYKNKFREFEIYSIDDLINPPSDATVFCIRRNIELKKGDLFNIYEQLKYYWLNTKSLHIEDDYLRELDGPKREGQFLKLTSLIKACKNLEKLTIWTSFKDKSQSSGIYLNEEQFKAEIIRNTGIKPEVNDRKSGERHYYTDYFNIHLGKGLDFFTMADCFKVWRPRVTISITPKENIYQE